MTDPPEPARARARRRADMQAAAQLANKRAGRRWRRPRCLSGSPDEAGPSLSRVARSTGRLTASPRLAKLNIDLAWLTSALKTWTISRRTRANKGLVRYYPGRAVNLGVFLQLNLPRTAAESNTVISRTLSTKVSSWKIQPMRAPFRNPAGSQRNVKRRPKTEVSEGGTMGHDENWADP